MNLGLAGRFEIVKQKVQMQDGVPVLDSDGNQILIGCRKKVADFNNLITNTGLDTFATEFKPTEYIYLSADNTEPVFTDNSLTSILGIASGETVAGASDTSQEVAWLEIAQSVRFGAGIATGNISKIATGASDDGLSKLFSIALIKNAGVSTTITKLPDEILDIQYTLRIYIPKADVTGGVITIGDDNYNVIIRPFLSSNWTSSPSLIDYLLVTAVWGTDEPMSGYGFPSEPTGRDMMASQVAYVNGSHCMGTIFSANLANLNFINGTKTLGIATSTFYIKIGITHQTTGKGIIKTGNETLTLPPFVISWGRYEGVL